MRTLAGLFAFTVNLGAVWGYIERIGHAIDLSTSQIGLFLGLSMLFQALGCLTAAATKREVNRIYPLLTALALQLFAIVLLSQASTPLAYAGAAAVWGYSWNFGLANLLGQIARLFDGERVLSFAPGAEALGAATGPMLVSSLLVPGDYSTVYTVAGIAVIASISLALWLAVHSNATAPSITDQPEHSAAKLSPPG